MKETQPLAIAIADRDMLVREALSALISEWPEFKVVIKATDAEDLKRQLDKYKNPVICLLSIGLAGMDNFLREYRYMAKWDNVQILALGQYHSDYMQTRLIKAGASGYLLKNCQPKELKKAFQVIAKKGLYYFNLSRERYEDIITNKIPIHNITTEQLELLQHITDGLSYIDMEKKMGITSRSVESKKDVLAKKLNIRSKEGLIVFALKAGLVQI